jgi:hypothetical protein
MCIDPRSANKSGAIYPEAIFAAPDISSSVVSTKMADVQFFKTLRIYRSAGEKHEYRYNHSRGKNNGYQTFAFSAQESRAEPENQAAGDYEDPQKAIADGVKQGSNKCGAEYKPNGEEYSMPRPSGRWRFNVHIFGFLHKSAPAN